MRQKLTGPSDGATLRRANLALVLARLREEPCSRAAIAAETGLNKATVSSLVAELASRGLVEELPFAETARIGRPAQPLRVVPHRAAGVGVEVNIGRVAGAVVGLDGSVLARRWVPTDTERLTRDAVFDALAQLVTDLIATVEEHGVAAGVTIAVPGLTDVDAGFLAFAPNLGWENVPVLDELRSRLGRPEIPLMVENDANLAAVGEHALGCAVEVNDVVYLTGEVGVGGGVILGGQLVRGAAGYTGEVGHMPLGPAERVCGCGRAGCWETQVGLAALLDVTDLDHAALDSGDVHSRTAAVRDRAASGDPQTLAGLERIGRDLGVGASILVNLVNPAMIVLGGYFAQLGEYMLEPARVELRSRVIAPDAGLCRLELSTLGFEAAILGGAVLALARVVDDPSVIPHIDAVSAVETSA